MRIVLAAVLFSLPAFAKSLKCDVTRLTLYRNIEIKSVESDGKSLTVHGTRDLIEVPEPGYTAPVKLSYGVTDWKLTAAGLTVVALASDQGATVGQLAQAKITLKGNKGTLSLLPPTQRVVQRLATQAPVRCRLKP